MRTAPRVVGVGVAPGAAADTATAAASRKAHHQNAIVVGTAKAKIRAGHRRTVRITLNRTGRRLLTKHHTLKVKLTTSQNGHVVRTRTITFKVNRPSKHKHP